MAKVTKLWNVAGKGPKGIVFRMVVAADTAQEATVNSLDFVRDHNWPNWDKIEFLAAPKRINGNMVEVLV